MITDAARYVPQAAQRFGVATTIVTQAAVGQSGRNRVVGQQHGLAGLLMPVGEILAHGLRFGEVLEAQDVHSANSGLEKSG
jgi:hypothetical protein